jgi:uncharacterized protein YbaP (TraB family)
MFHCKNKLKFIHFMKKYLLNKRTILVLFLLFLSTTLVYGQSDEAGSHHHMLWKVTSKDGEVNYLAGSVHIMKPGIYPLDPIYQKVFKKADQLVFELNFDSLKAHQMQLMQKYAMLQKGETLKEKVSPEIYKLLSNKLDSLGLPISRFKHFKPGFVSITIMDLKLMKAGYQPNSGIDMHFFNKAKKADKQIIGLETPAFQMKLLSDISGKLTDSFVKHNLQKAGQIIRNFNEIVSAWKQGDTASLDSLIQEDMRKDNPELYKKLVLERNHKWMPTIEKLFHNGKTTWVITGTGHMIGKKGVVAMLRKAGYQVEQL